MTHHIFTIARREFTAYFTSPIAYVYLITFLVVVNWLFFRGFFLIGQADMRSFFSMMPWIFLFFIPAVSMGKWAEERRQGTLELLFTLPIRDIDIVIAKFFAALALIITALFLTAPLFLTVLFLGNADLGQMLCGYTGLILLGSAYLTVGLFISSLTESQIIAFIAGVALSFLLLILGTPMLTGGASNILSQAMQYMGLAFHFESIGRGVLDSRDLFYYFSVTGLFLFLNLKVLERRARR